MGCQFQVGDILVRKKEYQNSLLWRWGNKHVEVIDIWPMRRNYYQLKFVGILGSFDDNRFDLVDSIDAKDSLSDFL